MGGLGLLTARWMVERGARHLLLTGRSAPSEPAREAIDAMERAGAQIVVAQADVADSPEMARVLETVAESMPQLRGVFHAAGFLDDGVLQQQTWERFYGVLRPKVLGAWNLHTLTLGLPLDFFVLYSSTAALLGSPGKGNHVAANGFLDSLAHYRRAPGFPALSINWGAWAQIGAAAAIHADERVARRGLGVIVPSQGLAILQQLNESCRHADCRITNSLAQIWRAIPRWQEAPVFCGTDRRRNQPSDRQ